MLSVQLRSLQRYLDFALGSLWLRVVGPGVEVAAIIERVRARTARLGVLLERFEAGTLKPRVMAVRAARAPRTGQVRAAAAAAARPWPEHVRGWLALVAVNNPSVHIRQAWRQRTWDRLSPEGELLTYGWELRRLVTQDAGMQAFVALSGEGRRVVRWLLRLSNPEAVPEILREPRRPRPPRPEGWKRRRRDRWAAPRPPRQPKPFAVPPPGMSYEERVARLLPVPAPRTEEDPRWPPGTIRYNYTSR